MRLACPACQSEAITSLMLSRLRRAQYVLQSTNVYVIRSPTTCNNPADVPFLIVAHLADRECVVKPSMRTSALAFGLAMLCSSLTWGCGGAANYAVQNKANFAVQNKGNQTSAVSGDAFFSVRNHRIVATSAPAAVPAGKSARSSKAPSRDSSLNHWHLE